MFNALPWWLTWIDGRALLLVAIIAGIWIWYWLAATDESNDERLIAFDKWLEQRDER
jgi:hypothetical protein